MVGSTDVWPQVASLTLGARGPTSPYSPFVFAGTARTQTRIRLWLSNPDAGQAVGPLTAPQYKTQIPHGGGGFALNGGRVD